MENELRYESTSGKLIHESLTREIIGAAMQVHRSLGSGFLEKVYENALAFELSSRSIKVEQQKAISVSYRGHTVGEYFADLLVSDIVIVELKTAEQLVEAHRAQTINYLRATGIRVGLILNFSGARLEWIRVVV